MVLLMCEQSSPNVEERIIKALSEDFKSASEIATELHIYKSQASKILHRLKEEGRVLYIMGEAGTQGGARPHKFSLAR